MLDKWQTDLCGTIERLKPQLLLPEDSSMEFLTFSEEDFSRWYSLLKFCLSRARRFEIHCWDDETQWFSLALRYGAEQMSLWKYGKIAAGRVTAEFSSFLLSFSKPNPDGIGSKMTPFFNIFLDDFFFSSHYGAEVSLKKDLLFAKTVFENEPIIHKDGKSGYLPAPEEKI